MECNCQIVNNTDQVISYAALGHSASTVEPNNFQKVLEVTNLQPKQASQNAFAQQASFTADWWAMVVQFEGDSNQYLLFNDVLPMAECETPSDGAASLHILQSGDMGDVRIDTFEHQDYTDSDGSCNDYIATKATILEKNEELEEIIEIILEILGA